jgi:1-acyl-sn-glycerol-3-phosphate acyltransferase
LQWGLHMCIYPEGTRNKTKEPLARFHDGAFRLAIDSGHAVLPAVIFHSKKVLPPGKTFFYWPHKVEMHFLEPISPKGMTVETLREKVFAAMKEHYTREGNVQ